MENASSDTEMGQFQSHTQRSQENKSQADSSFEEVCTCIVAYIAHRSPNHPLLECTIFQINVDLSVPESRTAKSNPRHR